MALSILYPRNQSGLGGSVSVDSLPPTILVPPDGPAGIDSLYAQQWQTNKDFLDGRGDDITAGSPGVVSFDALGNTNVITISGLSGQVGVPFPGVGQPDSNGEFEFFGGAEGLVRNPDFTNGGGGGGGGGGSDTLPCALAFQLLNQPVVPRVEGQLYGVDVGYAADYIVNIRQGTPAAPLAEGFLRFVYSALEASRGGINGDLPSRVGGGYRQNPLTFSYDLALQVFGASGAIIARIENRFTVEPDARADCEDFEGGTIITVSRRTAGGTEACACEPALRAIAGQIQRLDRTAETIGSRLEDINNTLINVSNGLSKLGDVADVCLFARTERGALDAQFLTAIRAAAQTIADAMFRATETVTGFAPQQVEGSGATIAFVEPESGEASDFNPTGQLLPTLLGGAVTIDPENIQIGTREVDFSTRDAIQASRPVSLSGFRQAAQLIAPSIPSTPTIDGYQGFANQLGLVPNTPEQVAQYRALLGLFAQYGHASNSVNQDENLDNIEDRIGDLVDAVGDVPRGTQRAVAVVTVTTASPNLRETLYNRESAIIRFGAVAFRDASGARGDVRYVTATRCVFVSDIENAVGLDLFPQDGVTFAVDFQLP